MVDIQLPRPESFRTSHSDPLLWGVCQCEPCWTSREAKRQADVAKRQADVAEREAKRAVWVAFGRHVWGSDFVMFCMGMAGLFTVWALGNIIYTWLYHGGLPAICACGVGG